jgi:hypothetical protein
MALCYSCKNELPQRGLHCPKCGVRAKCGQCSALLEEGYQFCVECGAAVDAPAQPNGSEQIEKSGGNFNVITYNDRTSNFNAKLSDKAFENGSEVLALLMANRMGVPAKRTRQTATAEDYMEPANTMDIDGGLEEEDVQRPAPVRVALTAGGSELQRLKDIFDEKNGVLTPIENRLKQKNHRDYARRLVVLFLYMHEILGRDRVARSAVMSLLDAAKINDDNARKWLSGGEMTVTVNEEVRLNSKGKESAKQFLAELDDDSVPDVPVAPSKKPKSKAESKSELKEEGDKSARYKKRGTSYRGRITELIAEGWFTDARRTGKQVQAELERRGNKFDMNRINDALKNNTVKKVLDREKVGEEWEYWKP